MAVITLTIAESPIQIVEGIPQTVLVTSNIPATIFYTFDGTTPTTSSSIATGVITMPNNIGNVTFQVFATNGEDSSAVVEMAYVNETYHTLRRPRDRVVAYDNPGQNLYPFGSASPGVEPIYGNTGGEPVSSPGNTNYPDGYDGRGNVVGYTDMPQIYYQNIYSTTDDEGRTGRFLGNLPAKVKVRVPPPPPDESQENSLLFNPKAMVIYQDGTKPPVDPTVSTQNKQYFSLTNAAVNKDGSDYYNTGWENPGISGSFLRPQYNPRDNTVTYYYYDNLNIRWIISKEPMNSKGNPTANLSHITVNPRQQGPDRVYQWIPFMRRSMP